MILSEHPYFGLRVMHIVMYETYPQKILYSRSFYVSCISGGVSLSMVDITTNYCCKNTWAGSVLMLHSLLRFWCSVFVPLWIWMCPFIDCYLISERTASRDGFLSVLINISVESVQHLKHITQYLMKRYSVWDNDR